MTRQNRDSKYYETVQCHNQPWETWETWETTSQPEMDIKYNTEKKHVRSGIILTNDDDDTWWNDLVCNKSFHRHNQRLTRY